MTGRLLLSLVVAWSAFAQTAPTYAERLGWLKTDRVLILHMDDGGMSLDSNRGIEKVLESGAARSLSVMMPTPWVPQLVRYLKAHPGTDAGLHLTLTSEWRDYRWGPLAGGLVPGLIDPEGALWSGVEAVVGHAKPEEVDAEIRAQLSRAERMGFHPTHLDSHMGTLFASGEYLEKYVQLGMEKNIPVMLPGGECAYLKADTDAPAIAQLRKEGKYRPGMELPSDATLAGLRQMGDRLWKAGLPVLDDLHNTSYGWPLPVERDDPHLQAWRTRRYMETLKELKPGVTMVIMHCTAPTETFAAISDSGDLRKSDMLAMLDPAFRKFLQQEGFIITTWSELQERRKRLK